MQRKATIFTLILLAMTFSLAFGQAYAEDFEDGDVSEWAQYRADEEMIQAVDMTSAPAVLVGGGDKVGYIQDLDYSYSGAAILLDGEVTDANYTVEADVYVYENASTSAYTGIVAYADSSHQGPHSYGYYVKLVADFDGDNRFRLYNNQLNFSTFQYSFHNGIDASGVDKTEGWHHMKVIVNTNADDNTVSYQCFYDEIDLGTYVDDSDLHTTMGQPGLYAFQQNGVDGLAGYFDNFTVEPNGGASELDHAEDFEDSDVSEWAQYRVDEEMIQAVDMTSAPAVLIGGGDKVGYIQDLDYSYSGAAILLTGETMFADYTVEADVYVYENASTSAYTGIVAYADSSHQGPHSYGYYVKLVADFDGDNRFRLYNNQLNFSTFQYSFHNGIDASGVDKTEGWHHMKVVVSTNPADSTVSYQCFYDEIDLGTYVDDSDMHTYMGQPGLYAFQQNGVDGLAGYFDNYSVVANGTTSIDNKLQSRPVTMTMHQNFPNPFNPSTSISFEMHEAGQASLMIYNIKGETITTLAQGTIQPGSYQVTWDGRDSQGQIVATGNYIAVHSKGNEQVSRNMLMLK
jgi:3-keto-L-gulonate-6-phosphate decarboxylase